MKLKILGSNMTEVFLSDGTRILVSYETPVAVKYVGPNLSIYITEKKWSRTTSKHITKWLLSFGYDTKESQESIEHKPQEFFDNLFSGVK